MQDKCYTKHFLYNLSVRLINERSKKNYEKETTAIKCINKCSKVATPINK